MCCATAASQRSGSCAAAARTHLIAPFLYRAWQALLATNVAQPSAPPSHYPLRSTTRRRHSDPSGSNGASSCRPSRSTDNRRPYSLRKEHKSTSTRLDLRYRPLATSSCLTLPSNQGMASTPPHRCRTTPGPPVATPARRSGSRPDIQAPYFAFFVSPGGYSRPPTPCRRENNPPPPSSTVHGIPAAGSSGVEAGDAMGECSGAR